MESIEVKKNKYDFAFLVFIALLLLRFFPFGILGSKIKDAAIMNIYYIGTYLLTAVFLILERNKLSEFNIDFISIAIIVLVPIAALFVYRGVPNSSYKISQSIANISIGVILIVLLLIKSAKLEKNAGKTILWIVISVMMGLLCRRLLKIYEADLLGGAVVGGSLWLNISTFLVCLSNASIMEDPLFRGFLWGYLRKRNIKQYWILLIQAVLFTAAHYNYFWLKDPAAFIPMFLLVFIWSSVYGIFAWLSRSIAPTMIIHGMMFW